MRKLLSFMLISAPVAIHSNIALNQEAEPVKREKRPLIDLPDSQLQSKMKALENRIQAQKDQLEQLSKAAKSPQPMECPEPAPAPKCSVVSAQALKAPAPSNAEIDELKKELLAKDSELKKKTREVVFLKNALAQMATKTQSNTAAVPSPEPTAQPVVATPATADTAENFDSRISFQFGYGPNGTQEKPVGTAGAVSVVTKYTAVFGVTYERQITPSWSFGVSALSNKTVLGSVGYGVVW